MTDNEEDSISNIEVSEMSASVISCYDRARSGHLRSKIVVFVSQQVQISYQLYPLLQSCKRLTFFHSTDIGSRDILLVQILDDLGYTSI